MKRYVLAWALLLAAPVLATPQQSQVVVVHPRQAGDVPGVARAGEPLPRPYVTLIDGTNMDYDVWRTKGRPNHS